MANTLHLRGQARDFYRDTNDSRDELDERLESLREHPEPDGVNKIAIPMPPVVIYVLDDDTWRVSYGFWKRLPSGDTHTEVYAISRIGS